jgi:hypothetical protein
MAVAENSQRAKLNLDNFISDLQRKQMRKSQRLFVTRPKQEPEP